MMLSKNCYFFIESTLKTVINLVFLCFLYFSEQKIVFKIVTIFFC